MSDNHELTDREPFPAEVGQLCLVHNQDGLWQFAIVTAVNERGRITSVRFWRKRKDHILPPYAGRYRAVHEKVDTHSPASVLAMLKNEEFYNALDARTAAEKVFDDLNAKAKP